MRGRIFSAGLVLLGAAASAASAAPMALASGAPDSVSAGSAASAPAGTGSAMPPRRALADVSCVRADHCVGVGAQANQNNDKTLAEVFNGKRWRVVSTPRVHGSRVGQLNGVSCTARDRCIAVGYYMTQRGTGHALIETYAHGRWTASALPQVGSAPSSLLGVSCTAARACVAVGMRAARTLVLSYSTGRWKVVASPNPPTAFSALEGVSCATRTRCAAYGQRDATAAPAPLVEVLRHGRWRITPVPAPAGLQIEVSGLSCGSRTRCALVGSARSGRSSAQTVPLAERLTRGRWTISKTPQPSALDEDTLDAVSCIKATRCVAVGVSRYLSQSPRLLIEAFSDGRWRFSEPRGPWRELFDLEMSAISCTASRACVAVGDSMGANAGFQGFSEKLAGTRWTHAPTA